VFPSGEWSGYWQQGTERGAQDLRLTFRNGSITGHGCDPLGEFAITGRYDDEAREVTFWKRYLGAHAVWYRGFSDGIEGIWGTWHIEPAGRGGFHIRPRGSGEHAEVAAAAEVPAEPARAGSRA
jgi:hypothetical protein